MSKIEIELFQHVFLVFLLFQYCRIVLNFRFKFFFFVVSRQSSVLVVSRRSSVVSRLKRTTT